jgi:alpha-galactosidase
MSFLDVAALPVPSFRYGGQSSTGLLSHWQRTESSESLPDGRQVTRRYADPQTGLQVTVGARTFDAFPAIEWVVEFEYGGQGDSPTLEEILPLDVTVPLAPQERLRLHHANGSSCRMDDFLPFTTELPPNAHKTLAPVGGRSSNGVFPFTNLQRGDCGMLLGVGWSGQWQLRFERGQDALRLAGGMEHTHLRLHAGEKIRTPRMLAILWEGDDPDRGANLLRQLLIANYLPRIDGQLVMPPVAQTLQFYMYLTGQAGEQYEMAVLPKVAELGAEAYWVDACWFGQEGEWWQQVGSWKVNGKRFPNGLRPISDAARQAGMKFLLWFEPERVQLNTIIHRQHPEFLLASDSNPTNLLFNLGLPEAREYLTDLLSRSISEHGVDIYRQDFNFDPLPYWQAADASDRIGMTEIRYVEGFYALWDELRRRHPGMWIDNCSSGGRRIDLETLSRSLPLWPSDFPDVVGPPHGLGLHVGDQCINAGLARWVPLFGGGMWNYTPYGTRGEIMGGFTMGFHIPRENLPADDSPTIHSHKDVLARGVTLLDDEFPMDQAKAAIAEWRSIRPYFLGDFHLLLPLTVSYHDWCAWQLHRPDYDAGVAIFFRRHRSPFPTMQVALRDVAPDAEYEVSLSTGYEEAPRVRMKGSALANMTIAIPEQPGSVLLRYRRVE